MRAYHLAVKILGLLLAVVLSAGTALAQPQKKQPDKDDERRRTREDMRETYRDRQGRPDRPRQMSPEERDKLRQDIEDANRAMRRKK